MSDTKAAPPQTHEEFIARYGDKLVSYKALNASLDALQGALIAAHKTQRDRITALEQRVTELETRPPGVEYDGIYDNGKSYTKGVLVSRKGGLWLSLRDDNGWAPGQSPQHWKLVVKTGEAER